MNIISSHICLCFIFVFALVCLFHYCCISFSVISCIAYICISQGLEHIAFSRCYIKYLILLYLSQSYIMYLMLSQSYNNEYPIALRLSVIPPIPYCSKSLSFKSRILYCSGPLGVMHHILYPLSRFALLYCSTVNNIHLL